MSLCICSSCNGLTSPAGPADSARPSEDPPGPSSASPGRLLTSCFGRRRTSSRPEPWGWTNPEPDPSTGSVGLRTHRDTDSAVVIMDTHRSGVNTLNTHLVVVQTGQCPGLWAAVSERDFYLKSSAPSASAWCSSPPACTRGETPITDEQQ